MVMLLAVDIVLERGMAHAQEVGPIPCPHQMLEMLIKVLQY